MSTIGPAVIAALAAALTVEASGGLRRAGRLPRPGDPTLGRTAGRPGEDDRGTIERVGRVLSGAAGASAAAIDPRDLGRGWAAAVASVPLIGVVAGPVAAGVVLVVLTAGPVAAGRRCRALRLAAIEAQVPVALDRVAGALRSGASLHDAIRDAARRTPDPVGEGLLRIAEEADRGQPLGRAIMRWVDGAPSTVQLAGAALSLGAEAGGGMARAVDGVAATVRERQEVVAEARSLATQARASAALLAVTPLLFAVLVSAADPAASSFLLGTPLGAACLVVGLGLEAAGLAWMGRITRSAGPAGVGGRAR